MKFLAKINQGEANAMIVYSGSDDRVTILRMRFPGEALNFPCELGYHQASGERPDGLPTGN